MVSDKPIQKAIRIHKYSIIKTHEIYQSYTLALNPNKTPSLDISRNLVFRAAL